MDKIKCKDRPLFLNSEFKGLCERDPSECYECMVQYYELKGCTRSDAQGIVDAELLTEGKKEGVLL